MLGGLLEGEAFNKRWLVFLAFNKILVFLVGIFGVLVRREF